MYCGLSIAFQPWQKGVSCVRRNIREDHHEWLEIYFFTPSPFEKAGAAWPIRVGENTAKPNYHIGPRTTPYYYLICVIDGQGTFIQNGQTYLLRKNDIFCLFPQVTHEYYTVPEEPLHKIFFAFDGKKALHLLERIGLRPHSPHASNVLSAETIELLEQFMELASEADAPNTDLARLSVFYQIWDRFAASAAPSPTDDERAVTWMQKGLEYMDIHYAEGISVERVSEYVGVNRTHFTKQFHKIYGTTPIQYIQNLKMNEAKLLLEQTSYTLSEIASSIGFPDLFSFSKAFKKHSGISPTQYRKQLAAKPE